MGLGSDVLPVFELPRPYGPTKVPATSMRSTRALWWGPGSDVPCHATVLWLRGEGRKASRQVGAAPVLQLTAHTRTPDTWGVGVGRGGGLSHLPPPARALPPAAPVPDPRPRSSPQPSHTLEHVRHPQRQHDRLLKQGFGVLESRDFVPSDLRRQGTMDRRSSGQHYTRCQCGGSQTYPPLPSTTAVSSDCHSRSHNRSPRHRDLRHRRQSPPTTSRI